MGGIGVVLLLVVVGTTIWVGIDASRRDWSNGSGAASWVVGCILLWLLVFPYYLAKRGKAPLKGAPAPVAVPAPDAMYRECPHCKEPMRRDASVCPHCRERSIPWRFHEGLWWYRASEQEPWRWLDVTNAAWVQLEQPTQLVETV